MGGGLRNISIRGKLLTLGVMSSVTALVLCSLVILISSDFILRADIVREISAQASIVAENTTAAIRFADSEAANETLNALRALSSIDVACLYDGKSTLLGSFVSPDSPEVCPSLPSDDGSRASWSGVQVVRPVSFKNARIGTVYLRANLTDVWMRLRAEGLALLIAFAIGSIGALVIASRLRTEISAPILALSTTTAEISQHGDYSLRAVKEGDDEIGKLVDTFNEMMRRAESRDEELRSANRLKDEFLATLSHELRTPLNAIVGWLHVLKLTPADPAVTERAMVGLDRNARIQVRLIEDLLDVSRIERGQLKLSFNPTDLAAVLRESLEVVRPQAEANGLTIAAPENLPPHMVLGDAGRLEQVLWNLLSNAVKFTPNGGHIWVTLMAVGDEFVLRVRDDGIGIPADFLPSVFDRFRQADGSFARRYGGLGVGLAIASELVERHGGRIVAESAGPSQGAMFTVYLPKTS